MANTQSPDQKQAPIFEVLAQAMYDSAPTASAAAPGWATKIVEGLRAAGYVIVPLEPTEAMLKAAGPAMQEVDEIVAFSQMRTGFSISCPDDKPPLAHAWRAMVEASQ